jgi:hypothetical protein
MFYLIFSFFLGFLFKLLYFDVVFVYIFDCFRFLINWLLSIKPIFFESSVDEAFVVFYYFLIFLAGKSLMFLKNKT